MFCKLSLRRCYLKYRFQSKYPVRRFEFLGVVYKIYTMFCPRYRLRGFIKESCQQVILLFSLQLYLLNFLNSAKILQYLWCEGLTNIKLISLQTSQPTCTQYSRFLVNQHACYFKFPGSYFLVTNTLGSTNSELQDEQIR